MMTVLPMSSPSGEWTLVREMSTVMRRPSFVTRGAM